MRICLPRGAGPAIMEAGSTGHHLPERPSSLLTGELMVQAQPRPREDPHPHSSRQARGDQPALPLPAVPVRPSEGWVVPTHMGEGNLHF